MRFLSTMSYECEAAIPRGALLVDRSEENALLGGHTLARAALETLMR